MLHFLASAAAMVVVILVVGLMFWTIQWFFDMQD